MIHSVCKKGVVFGIILLFVGATAASGFTTIQTYANDHPSKKITEKVNVTFISKGCHASIYFNNIEYYRGQTIEVETGQYPIRPGVSTHGCKFDLWIATGGLTVTDPYAAYTNVTVSDDGSLTICSHSSITLLFERFPYAFPILRQLLGY